MVSKIIASKWTQFFMMLAVIVGLAVSSFGDFNLKNRLQYLSFDTLNKLYPRQPSNQVMIIDIDEESLREIGQWPWPRDVMADLVFKLKGYGVSATVFDMVFAEPDRTSPHLLAGELGVSPDALRNNDDVFAKAIAEAGNVVMGFTFVTNERSSRGLPAKKSSVLMRKKDKKEALKKIMPLRGLATNLPEFSKNAAGVGLFLAPPSEDGIIRKIPLIASYKDEVLPAIAIEGLRVANNKKERIKIISNIRTGNQFQGDDFEYYKMAIGEDFLELNLPASAYFPVKYRELSREKDYVSAYKILNDQYDIELREKLFEKVIFVGTSVAGLNDIRSTPLNLYVPGVEVHVNIAEQILQGDFLKHSNLMSSGLSASIIIFVGLIILLGSLFFGVFLLTIVTVMSLGGLVVGTSIAYNDYGLLFDPLYPSICIILIFIITTVMNYMRTESQAKEVKEAFGMYLSPDVLKEVTNNPDMLKLGGEMRELSVLFTDIRNFTTISESLTPEELINTMNDFLTPMSDVVMKTRGTIDKYMGDAMMAFWNAPLDDENHARHAVKAAIEMRHVLDPINRELEAKAKKTGVKPLVLAAGMGVNTGLCSVGNMGSKQRFAYSALGDAVNLASRLEGQTKSYGLDLLIGEDTAAQVRDFAVVEIDKIQVKGKTKPVRIYTVLGDDTMGGKTSFRKFRVAHKLFIRDYRRANFDSASARLQELMIDKYGQTLKPYYNIMMDRMVAFQQNPPKQGWDGVFIATSK